MNNIIENVQGEIKVWYAEKGFGFVRTELYGDVFLNKSVIKNDNGVEKGQKVRITIEPSKVKKGEYQVCQIHFAEEHHHLLAKVEWFNGTFGVAKFQNSEYFIHKNEIKYGYLDEEDLIIFVPTHRHNKLSASKVVLIDSSLKLDSNFKNLSNIFLKSEFKNKIQILNKLSPNIRIELLKLEINVNNISANEVLKYMDYKELLPLVVPYFDITYSINHLDILKDKEKIQNLPKEVFEQFIHTYLGFTLDNYHSVRGSEEQLIEILNLIKWSDLFEKHIDKIIEYFINAPFDWIKKSTSKKKYSKNDLLNLIPPHLHTIMLDKYMNDEIGKVDIYGLINLTGWKEEYYDLYEMNLDNFFEKTEWNKNDSSIENPSRKILLSLLPFDTQKKLVDDYIERRNSLNTVDMFHYIDFYSQRVEEDNQERISKLLTSVNNWLNKYSLNRNTQNTFKIVSSQFLNSNFQIQLKCLQHESFFFNENIKIQILNSFTRSYLSNIYDYKEKSLKVSKYSYVSSQISKIATKLGNTDFIESLEKYKYLSGYKESITHNDNQFNQLLLFIYDLSDAYDFNTYCYYFFMLNRLEQWIFSKKMSAILGEEVKQSMLKQRQPWQFIQEFDGNIDIYEATWKSIWFDDKKIKLLTNSENLYSDYFNWEFSEYKFNFLYDYITGRQLTPLTIKVDKNLNEIIAIDNLEELSEIVFKAEIQRLYEKGDHESINKLISENLIKIPIPINSVLRNECLIYLNKLQLSGLEPTRLLERAVNLNSGSLSFEQSFLYTIPIGTEEFAIIWESLEIDKAKATHIFKCRIQDYQLIFSDIQNFLSSYTGVRSILNNKNEQQERKSKLGYYRRIDHDNFMFDKWQEKLHNVLPI